MRSYINTFILFFIPLWTGDSAPHQSYLILCFYLHPVILQLGYIFCMPINCCQIHLRKPTGTSSIANTDERSRTSAPLFSFTNVMLAFCTSTVSILQRQFYILGWIVHKTHLPGHECLWLYLDNGIYGYGSLSALLKEDHKKSR